MCSSVHSRRTSAKHALRAAVWPARGSPAAPRPSNNAPARAAARTTTACEANSTKTTWSSRCRRTRQQQTRARRGKAPSPPGHASCKERTVDNNPSSTSTGNNTNANSGRRKSIGAASSIMPSSDSHTDTPNMKHNAPNSKKPLVIDMAFTAFNVCSNRQRPPRPTRQPQPPKRCKTKTPHETATSPHAATTATSPARQRLSSTTANWSWETGAGAVKLQFGTVRRLMTYGVEAVQFIAGNQSMLEMPPSRRMLKFSGWLKRRAKPNEYHESSLPKELRCISTPFKDSSARAISSRRPSAPSARAGMASK
mmetsp:Transcript_94362/g.271859  ORF Transcript_94362/g.271859 Transcript_94362/m.271859 type:complete len:310 (-) Transcript_94362:66-995(-)